MTKRQKKMKAKIEITIDGVTYIPHKGWSKDGRQKLCGSNSCMHCKYHLRDYVARDGRRVSLRTSRNLDMEMQNAWGGRPCSQFCNKIREACKDCISIRKDECYFTIKDGNRNG